MSGPPVDPTAGGSRADYLRIVSELLWRAPNRVVIDRRRSPLGDRLVSEFVVVPDARSPRLLVPTASRRAAAAAMRRYAEPHSTKARIRTAVLAAGLATGVLPLFMRDRLRVYGPDDPQGVATPASLEAYLRSALDRDLVISMHISRPRANRKPVLQLLTRTGETVAFVKVGTNPLTRQLVRAEAESLAAVAAAGMTATTTPVVLHHGTWQDLDVLVSSALPVWQPRVKVSAGQLGATIREIAAIAGVHRSVLAVTPYWPGLVARTRDVAAPERDLLGTAVTRIAAAAGATPLLFGSWHGDFAPWNIAGRGDTLLVWDWERFTAGVPVGFDALHYDIQPRILHPGAPPDTVIAARLAAAPHLLTPMGVAIEEIPLLWALYLLEITTRYLLDGQREAGSWAGLIPGLLRALDVATASLPAQAGHEAGRLP